MKQPLETDPVIAAYRAQVDRSLLRVNLRLTPAERLAKLQSALAFMAELRQARPTIREAPSTER